MPHFTAHGAVETGAVAVGDFLRVIAVRQVVKFQQQVFRQRHPQRQPVRQVHFVEPPQQRLAQEAPQMPR